MALAFVAGQVVTASEATGTGTYTTGAFPGSITVGNTLIAVVSSDATGVSQVTSLTDSKGNVWVKDIQAASTLGGVFIWRAPITVGGTGATVTVNYDAGSSNNSGVAVQEFSSASPLTLDKTKAATVTSITQSTGASAATTVANELVVAGLAFSGATTTVTVGAGYSNLATPAFVTGSGTAMESAVIAATGAQTATFTLGASRNGVAALATYYETAVAVTTSYMPTRIANKMVGPMALRMRFRQPYTPVYYDAPLVPVSITYIISRPPWMS